jgi:inosine-uridine nucleoside N-ribohydrolase
MANGEKILVTFISEQVRMVMRNVCTPVWLDYDSLMISIRLMLKQVIKGHDDAVAILLKNAVRLVLAFASNRPDIVVHPGAAAPLLRAPRADPEIRIGRSCGPFQRE